MREVMVALRMAGEAGQGKMSGIYRFLSEGHPWNVKIVESTHELTPSAVADAVRDGTEGFIISLLDPEKNLAALAESSATP